MPGEPARGGRDDRHPAPAPPANGRCSWAGQFFSTSSTTIGFLPGRTLHPCGRGAHLLHWLAGIDPAPPLEKGIPLMAASPPNGSSTFDDSAEFVGAVSLLAALEADTAHPGHRAVLPYLGMARAELTDFGQRRPTVLVPVDVEDLAVGLRDLDEQLALMRAHSPVLQHTLRIDAARRFLGRGRAALD